MSNFGNYSTDWNPFTAMIRGESHVARQVARRSAKNQQDRATQNALTMIAANHQATTLQNEQNGQIAQQAAEAAHRRSEVAADAAHGRRQEFFTSAMKHVAPGSQFSVNIDGQQVSGVKRGKTTPTTPVTPPEPIKAKVPPRARTPKG